MDTKNNFFVILFLKVDMSHSFKYYRFSKVNTSNIFSIKPFSKVDTSLAGSKTPVLFGILLFDRSENSDANVDSANQHFYVAFV